MTLPHNNATARVTIDGLAVCCYNGGQTKWEVGYLHQADHRLILAIENETSIEIPNTTREITIGAVKPHTPSYPGEPHGFFSMERRPLRTYVPTSADELENFRWIVDLQDPTDTGHGNATPKQATSPVTRALIHNAVLYTSRLSAKEVIRAAYPGAAADNPNNMDPATLERHIFGRTNNETAGDIFCANDGAVTLTIPGVISGTRTFPHRPGQPWNIKLTNLCYHPGGTTIQRFKLGDFHRFYDVINVSNQKQCIWGEATDKHIVDTGRVDCDTTWLSGLTTLDPIML
jgi:hypothetical protein